MINSSHRKRFEQGSAHIWIIVVLVLIIAGLIGYVFWQQVTNDNDADQSTENTSKISETADSKNDKQTNSYTSSDPGTYVKSFKYPKTWGIATANDLCKDFNICAGAPKLALTSNASLYFSFTPPQSASEVSIDEEAANRRDGNDKNGTVAKDFTSLDGLAARKIDYSNGDVDVVVSLRGGYGIIQFTQSNTDDIDTILSSWKWA